MNNKTVTTVKAGLTIIAQLGISMLAGAATGFLITSSGNNSKLLKKTVMAFGGFIVGGLLADKVEAYVDSQVDQTIEIVDTFQKSFNRSHQEVS